MNKDNLVPGAHKLTPEENSLGGVNSGISRREKKRALEIARDILSMPVDDGDPVDVNDLPSLNAMSEVTTDVMTSILAKVSQKAINGDIKASKLLLEISGDYARRQESRILLDEDKYDDDHTEYIIHIEIIGDDPTYEVQYYDENNKLDKVIYGKEAKRLVDEAVKRFHQGKGKPLQYQIGGVRTFDGENIIIHSFDEDTEDIIIPADEYYPPDEYEKY